MKIFIILSIAFAVSAEIEGPACLDSERYDCKGSTVPVADPTDCTVFYNCDAQIQQVCPSKCPPGLYYDPKSGVCNWPDDVVCASFLMRDIEGPACLPSERYDCQGVEHPIGDPADCTVFYNCDAQIQQVCPSKCPPGLYYDPKSGVCNWPDDVVCASKIMSRQDGPACADNERYECNGYLGRIRDENDCSVFYNCDSNVQRPCPSTCPPGLVFNQELEICDWPTSVTDC